MEDLLAAKDRLAIGLNRGRLPAEPIIADEWIVKSLLQKAVRRGEVEVAQRAALTFLAQKGAALWKRLIIIAFEDIGAGSPDVVAMSVAASTDSRWRKTAGGEAVVAVHLARLLAEAPKSRSAEHLITSANHHPFFEQDRRLVSISSTADNLAVVADISNSLIRRALAAWRVSGIGWNGEKKPYADLPGLLLAYRKLGVPEELVTATGIASAKTRDPITLMSAMSWLAANRGQVLVVVKAEVPRSPVLGGVALYALDKHTRLGLEAIRNLVECSPDIRDCLERYVPRGQINAAAYMAAFYADAAPLALKLSWDGADELEALGTEADMLKAGVSPEGIQPLLRSFRANLQRLNEVRAHILRKRLGIGAGCVMADEEV